MLTTTLDLNNALVNVELLLISALQDYSYLMLVNALQGTYGKLFTFQAVWTDIGVEYRPSYWDDINTPSLFFSI